MRLHPIVDPPHVILELPAGRVEGVTDGDMRILVGMILGWVPGRHNFAPGYGQFHSNVEQPALPMVAADLFQHDATGNQPVVEFFELCDPFAYLAFDGIGRLHVPV